MQFFGDTGISAVHYPTDTTHPQAAIPIYRIHSIAAPFCDNPACWCRVSQAQVRALFAHADTGTLQLKEAHGDGLTLSVSVD